MMEAAECSGHDYVAWQNREIMEAWAWKRYERAVAATSYFEFLAGDLPKRPSSATEGNDNNTGRPSRKAQPPQAQN